MTRVEGSPSSFENRASGPTLLQCSQDDQQPDSELQPPAVAGRRSVRPTGFNLERIPGRVVDVGA